MAAVPDMSHLTPEEIRAIEHVMTRYQEEEEKANEVVRRKQNEVKILEEKIRACSEQQKKAGVELTATCRICLKTKFADGIGHICNYCRTPCCTRCSGKLTLRSNKAIWVCIVCRKKQELLSRTGQWMTETGLAGADNAMPRRTSDMQVGVPPGLVDQTQDKRPKLERAHSAAEKENLPLLRSGSLLRRQYSQQEQVPGRRLSTSDSGVEMSVSPHSRTLPMAHAAVGSYPVTQQTPRHPSAYPEDDPNLYRGEIDGLMRQYPQQNYQRQRQVYQDQNTDLAMAYGQPPEVGPPRTTVRAVQQHSMQGPHSQPCPPGQAGLHQQRSYSSSEEERSTPECASDEPDESEKGEKPPPMGVTSWSSREQPGDRMNRQFLAHSLSWQPNRDGTKLIGHMVLRKQHGSGSSSSILGLKVVGGKLLDDGSVGALIEKVKKGSTADIEGQLRPGDEVVMWNGRLLQGKTPCEVSDIITESRQMPEVELVVARSMRGSVAPMGVGPTPSTPIGSRRMAPQNQWRQKHESMPGPQQPHHKGLKKCILWELYDARREKPSVLVTSPGSPDLHGQGRARHLRQTHGNASIGGLIQVQLGYDSATLRLIVTLVCATGLTPRSNGQPRNPYAKIFLITDKSKNPKTRTNTLANTNDPKWNQTFYYDGIRRSDLRKGALEITVWDYGRCDANDFLGEVVIDLGVAALHDELEWYPLTAHEEHRHIGYYQEPENTVITPVDRHLSPPSTTSRLSDSDTSECDITDCDVSREHRRTTDGASISSIGSSSRFHNMPSNYKRHYSSPPPERELCVDAEHRSRRDMSPQSRKRAAIMIRDQPASISGYQSYRKDDIHREMMGHRSHSAAPMDSPSIRYRGRSQSPTGHRSLSPPEHRSIPYSHGYIPRFSSRSATATPTGSPKKRQLPQIPAAMKERTAQDFDERARFMRHRNRQVYTTYRSTGMGGWERYYSGLSDSDLPSIGHNPLSLSHSHAYRMHRPRRGHLSPDKEVLGGDLGDSDMESIASVTSSALSTQSERPRGSRGLIEYSSQSGSYEKTSRQVTDNGHDESEKRGQFTRSLSNADGPSDEKVDGSLSDTAIGLNVENGSRRSRKSSPGSKSGSGSSSGGASTVQYQPGLGKKSNSTSQLSATGGTCVGDEGRKRRLGFGKKEKSSFTVHRSEEVMPEDTGSGRSGRQPSSASSDGEGSGDGDSSWSPSLRMASESGALKNFIKDLGPGQIVGMQALAAACFGEIQLLLSRKDRFLEIEVIRAKDLLKSEDSKQPPASYVKVYLVSGKKCISKAKTAPSRPTLEPFYKQVLKLDYTDSSQGCILEVTVWGDYGRFGGRKVFMGIAHIVLDELKLKENEVIGWYKLFTNTSLGVPSNRPP